MTKHKLPTPELIREIFLAEQKRMRDVLAEFLPADQVDEAFKEVDDQIMRTSFAAFQLKLHTDSIDNLSNIILIQVISKRLNLDTKLTPDLRGIAHRVARFVLGKDPQ